MRCEEIDVNHCLNFIATKQIYVYTNCYKTYDFKKTLPSVHLGNSAKWKINENNVWITCELNFFVVELQCQTETLTITNNN